MGFKNIGQLGGTSGIDIKICDAWQLSTGNNIIAAVVDNGINLSHPDLFPNIYSLSWNSESGTSPQKKYRATMVLFVPELLVQQEIIL